MKMECSIVRDLLPLYVEDMVSPETAKYVSEHLKVCSECEAELATVEEQIEYYQSEREKFAALLRANEETAAAQKRREQLDTVIIEIAGLNEIFLWEPQFLQILSKLEGLKVMDDVLDDFQIYRKTVFEIINLLQEFKNGK